MMRWVVKRREEECSDIPEDCDIRPPLRVRTKCARTGVSTYARAHIGTDAEWRAYINVFGNI
jgi:hypothetical protein